VTSARRNWYSLRGLATALRVLLIIDAVVLPLTILSGFFLRSRLHDYVDGTASRDDVRGAVALFGLLFIVVAGVSIAVIVLTIIWQWRLAKNHERLGRPGTTLRAGWAIGGWFIPLANYVLPMIVFVDIWKGSDPGLGPDDPEWKRSRVSPVLIAWWTCWVVGSIINVAFRNDTTGSVDTLAEAVDSFDRALRGVAVSYAVLTAAAILYVVVVGQLTRRQEQAMARADAVLGAGGAVGVPGASGWGITAVSGPAAWPAPVDRLPGWKSDPSRQAYYRWWDGQRWGHETSNGA
jgi:hypothetical protein